MVRTEPEKPLTGLEDRVLRILRSTSSSDPMAARMVASYSGLNQRILRDIVSSLRLRGFPVVSGDKGYWWGTAEECRRAAKRLRAHAVEEMQAASALDHTANVMDPRPSPTLFS